MIRIVFHKKDGQYISLRSEGHAGKRTLGGFFKLFWPKEYGNILCSAISVLLLQFKVNITTIEKARLLIDIERKGFMELVVCDADAPRIRSYFEGLIVMLKSIELQHKDRLRIIMEDIHVT